ncbi:Splicing factor 3B subunit 1 [Portunus trituberculatus]|uniref:Splicing factor 3B subunit 1 n=1 Tax=Portunus trituberculatus TaxID=210409 RepID=A0A5B7JVF4_PORTR|nr:Splicing factor 3B subunit 1 [Portunus trituberculatus]
MPQVDKDHDPMAQYKRPTIADREDEYRARRIMQVISPERLDPFADGRCPPTRPPHPSSRLGASVYHAECVVAFSWLGAMCGQPLTHITAP